MERSTTRPYQLLEAVDLADLCVQLSPSDPLEPTPSFEHLRGQRVFVPIDGPFVAHNTEGAQRLGGKALGRQGRTGTCARIVAVADRYWAEEDVEIGDPPVTVGGHG